MPSQSAININIEEVTKFFILNPHLRTIAGFDLETTGFARESKIVEVGIVKFTFDGINVKYSSFSNIINIHENIPKEAMDVHGITMEMMEKQGAEEAAVYQPMLDFLSSSQIIIGHNIAYDKRILVNNLHRRNMSIGTVEDRFECTLRLAKKSKLNLSSLKLVDIGKHFGYINENAHRAVDDALESVYVYTKLLEASRMGNSIRDSVREF